MKFALVLLSAIVLAAAGAPAQNTLSPDPAANAQWTLSPFHLGHADCPIDLEARHGSGLGLQIRVGAYGQDAPPFPNQPPRLTVAKLLLTVTNRLSREIVSEQITVHGFSGKGRIIGTSSNGPGTPDLEKTLHLSLNVKGRGRASADLALRGFTTVSRIDINSITYSDGSIWVVASPGACSVTPDPFMLVSAVR